jgi:hypothetical protein
MEKDEEVAIEAINVFTAREQMIRFGAELAELLVETNNLILGGNNIRAFASEFADVKFTMLQANIILQNTTKGEFNGMLDVEYNYKVDRTKALIESKKREIELQKQQATVNKDEQGNTEG